MAKVDPSEETGSGPLRTSSGTRVVAVRLNPVTPSVASQPSANDISQRPTMVLDLAELREMALRCASDVGPAEQVQDPAPEPATHEPSRPRLELVLSEDETPLESAESRRHAAQLVRSRRSGGVAFVLVLLVLAMATVGALRVYGILR